MSAKPDVGEQPRPAAIAVVEWMDFCGAVMNGGGLVENSIIGLPRRDVQYKPAQFLPDQLPARSDICIDHARLAVPLPHVAKHRLVDLQEPIVCEGRLLLA